MSLAAGTRLGPYEVLAPLGAGGMGEVYRALDPRLHREVAVKLLPPAFALDAGRLQRFEREARLLASLQHPRVASVHGLEESDGRRFLVMELVRGESLEVRLSRGAMPVEQALDVARQIAEGLEAAHAQGIVHRDLKPSNVQLGPDGSVKLLDFGLAKALDTEAPLEAGRESQSPTLSGPMTSTGVILGTAGYMSPEQARGGAVDRRSDVWALGCVLYQMLSGRRTFTGQTVSDILAAVLRADPDWSSLPATLPDSVHRLLRRCLEKHPERRLHDVADARIELEDALDEIRTGRTTPLSRAALAAAAAPRRGLTGLAIAAGLAVLAAGAAIGRMTATTGASAGPGGPRSRVHALVAMPEGQQLAGWAWPVLALSPDGRTLAFVAEPDGGVQQLYLYHLDSGRTQLVPESAEAEGPFFSPDGAFVAFAVDVSGSPRPGQLKKFSLKTGLTQAICGIRDYFGGDWLADDTILFVENPPEGLARVSSAGGRPEAFLSSAKLEGRDEARVMLWPQALPGDRKALVAYEGSERTEVAVVDLTTRELKPLGIEAAFARYARSGHLLYVHRDGTLLAAPFDHEQARTTGPALAIARDVAFGMMEASAVTASGTGMLAYATGYVRGSGRELSRLVKVVAGAAPQPLPFDPDTYNRFPRASPDGGRIAVTSSDGSLWIHDLGRGSRSRLLAGDVGGRGYPVWTPDGERVVFVSGRGPAYRLFTQLADGSGAPDLLPMQSPAEKHPGGVTADGRILFASNDPPGIHLVNSATKAVETILAESTVDMPTLSPDGRRLAYDSTESGRREVYLRDYPGMSGKRQVSTGGGRSPRFTRDGRSLFFMGLVSTRSGSSPVPTRAWERPAHSPRFPACVASTSRPTGARSWPWSSSRTPATFARCSSWSTGPPLWHRARETSVPRELAVGASSRSSLDTPVGVRALLHSLDRWRLPGAVGDLLAGHVQA